MSILAIIVEWLLVMVVCGWLVYRVPRVWRTWMAALRASRVREGQHEARAAMPDDETMSRRREQRMIRTQYRERS